jgi:ABC-type uncharacterized transport system fused permease/ATPase subunit
VTAHVKEVLKLCSRPVVGWQDALPGILAGSARVDSSSLFPVVVVAPRYFAKQIRLGNLMRVVNAFSFVQNSLSFIVNSYADIAALQAVTQRLSRFEERLFSWLRRRNPATGFWSQQRSGASFGISNLSYSQAASSDQRFRFYILHSFIEKR